MTKALLLFFLLLLPTVTFGVGRESGGGGGNGFVAEFRRLGAQIGQAFYEHQVITVKGRDFDHARFREGWDQVVLTPTDEPLKLDGKAVSAINYPARNEIVFNKKDWAGFDRDAKLQLVIHEVIGLKLRGVIDDSTYAYSQPLLEVVKKFTVEGVALAMARAGNAFDFRMKVIPERTKVVENKPDGDGLGNWITTEVAIRTFENDSATSIRVYRVKEHDMLGVDSAELLRLEGAAGG